MLRQRLAGLMVLPVILAAWLTFSTRPVSGLPLHEIAMYDLPAEGEEVAKAEPAIQTESE